MAKFIIQSLCSLCLLVITVSPSLFFWVICLFVQPDSSLVRFLLVGLGLVAFLPVQVLVGSVGSAVIVRVWLKP